MADDGTGSPSPCWADLQPELLRLVLRRLPTLGDRVRLRAVCRAWCREPLPVPFPWLALPDGTSFLSVPDGATHRFPALLPEGLDGGGGLTTCHGSVGSWLFLTQYKLNARGLGVGRSLSLANPFTGDVVPLPDVATICRHEGQTRDDYVHPPSPSAFKLVHLAPPPSPLGAAPAPADSLFAVLMPAGASRSLISICRPPAAATAFIVPGGERAYDAAFFDGKLYAIAYKQLYIFDVDATATCKGKPAVPPMRCIANFVEPAIPHGWERDVFVRVLELPRRVRWPAAPRPAADRAPAVLCLCCAARAGDGAVCPDSLVRGLRGGPERQVLLPVEEGGRSGRRPGAVRRQALQVRKGLGVRCSGGLHLLLA
jgi:hypothetical protein